MKRTLLLVVLVAALLGVMVLPTLAQESIIDGTLGTANILPNGRPDDNHDQCTSPLVTSGPGGNMYYQLFTLTVTESGFYDYVDLRNEPALIDIWVTFYTSAPDTFDPANPLGNGCFANFDDDNPPGELYLSTGVTYTLMVSSYNSEANDPGDPQSGDWRFSLEGTGEAIVSTAGGSCPNPLPAGSVVRSVPAGAPVYYAADASTLVTWTLAPGSYWITQTSGDFAQVWQTCQGNRFWIPSSAVSQ